MFRFNLYTFFSCSPLSFPFLPSLNFTVNPPPPSFFAIRSILTPFPFLPFSSLNYQLWDMDESCEFSCCWIWAETRPKLNLVHLNHFNHLLVFVWNYSSMGLLFQTDAGLRIPSKCGDVNPAPWPGRCRLWYFGTAWYRLNRLLLLFVSHL